MPYLSIVRLALADPKVTQSIMYSERITKTCCPFWKNGVLPLHYNPRRSFHYWRERCGIRTNAVKVASKASTLLHHNRSDNANKQKNKNKKIFFFFGKYFKSVVYIKDIHNFMYIMYLQVNSKP